ncbi:MAG: hypothetical protein HGA55_07010 [Methanoregulaceae archaeon]|nr:hypothetical protein [Methanoregulaceae archaeon]
MKVLPEQKVDGKSCYVIEARSKYSDDPVGRTINWLDRKTGVTLKTVAYDRADKEIDVDTVFDVKIDDAISSDIFVFHAPDGEDNIGITNLTWSFPYRGAHVEVYGETFNYTFTELGDHRITLRASDASGLYDVAYFTVSVSPGPPEPDLDKERDRLGIETTEYHAALEDRKKRLRETGYDEEKKKDLERELARLIPVRDESIGIRDRLSRETGILVMRDQARTAYDRLTGEKARIRDCLAGIGWSGESFEAVQASLDAIDNDLRQCSAERATVQERIVRLESVLSQVKTCCDEADRLLDRLELQKITRKTIAEYIVYLMQVVRSRIEGDVGRILSDITAGRYDRVLIDDDFGLLVRDIDNDYPVERFSGGEQDDIAVALRIALSRYLATLHQVPEPTFLIFDEIFGSQDEERRNNLLSALRSIESHFPQILLISHIPELQGEFAHTLLIELGSDQVSRIQEVTQ